MPARHEVRDDRRLPGVRRQGRRASMTAPRRRSPACARSWCWTISSRWSAITCGRRRRAWTRSTSTWNEGPNARSISAERIWDDCAGASSRTAWSRRPWATSPKGARPAATRSRRRLSSCRSSPTPRWSRSTAPCTCAPDACEIWTGTQVMTRVRRRMAAKATGLPAREGHRPQPPARRRLRPPAGAGHGRGSGARSPSRSTAR